MAKTLELEIGYTDKDGTTHLAVEFGKQLTGRDLFAIDDDPQSINPDMHQFMMLRQAITKFGTLTIPVALQLLVELDSLDRDGLIETFNESQSEGLEGREAKPLPGNKLQLAGGYDYNGLLYDVAEFGTRLTGRHYVEASEQGLKDARRAFFLVGQQVAKMSQSSGTATLSGPLTLEACEKLLITDLFTLRAASEVWRQSFRRPRKGVQGERDGADSATPDESHGTPGS